MDIPPELREFAPGAAGSLVALPFLQGPWSVRVAMVLGGSALSFYGTKPVASWMQVINSDGLIGFLIGLFGMALVAKAHELIAALNVSDIGMALKDWVRKKLGV